MIIQGSFCGAWCKLQYQKNINSKVLVDLLFRMIFLRKEPSSHFLLFALTLPICGDKVEESKYINFCKMTERTTVSKPFVSFTQGWQCIF